MDDLLKLLVGLQNTDTRIIEKRLFIAKVPKRIFEVDQPLKRARTELEKMRQKNDELSKKKHDMENQLDDINDKVQKMRSRISDIKTNKEYQAHLREIETFEKEIDTIEERILLIMEELDHSLRDEHEKEGHVKIEEDKMTAFKKQLDQEVKKHEDDLVLLKEERERIVQSIEPDLYDTYMKLMDSGNGLAVTRAEDEICLGCNMHVPPQLFVEIRKNEDIHQCPQCRRILYHAAKP